MQSHIPEQGELVQIHNWPIVVAELSRWLIAMISSMCWVAVVPANERLRQTSFCQQVLTVIDNRFHRPNKINSSFVHFLHWNDALADALVKIMNAMPKKNTSAFSIL